MQLIDKDLLSMQEVRELVEAAKEAQQELARMDQAQVDRIVRAIADAGVRNARRLAQMANEDTGFGIVDDKVIKNIFASRGVYEHIKDMKTIGEISRDDAKRLRTIAVPVGVIAGLIPSILRAAPIRLGLVTVEQRGLKARELTLDEIPAGKVKDYLMASAACFPALRARDIDGVKFLDGGYSDNMPTGLAKRMGAEELVCVDLEGVGITRPNLTGLPTVMVRSYWELGDILHFDPDTARRNIELGYYDTRRAMGYLRGCAYAVSCDAQSCADAAAFHAKFERVQKQVREKYPVTLTADAALLLANMKDADLAPLEAAAEDVGVSPTGYYTTHTLCDAFLAKCDQARMQSFAPLFEGSADAARAALAALLPNTFLQALVWHTLTAPEAELLPEVNQNEDL